ncbi:CAMK kinase [Fusarium pseudocircinatum]|uniref:CAMK kinase n=1 Tax=Fusarium pseudocircinatum TaxID=56676 RepID=A0A8H5NZ22_9HYPO|nr:CAMK kinase [Fusarium pseudocircinatum]
MEEDTTRASQESPAAYLHLVDTRSEHQSQRTLFLPCPRDLILHLFWFFLTRFSELFPVWEREIFKIGRDPRANTLAVDNDLDFAVSRNHCEVYVVVYEPTINHIYVRDRKSSNGTFVNGQLIGSVLQDQPPPRHELTSLQLEECKLFASKYHVSSHCLGQGAEAVVCLANDVQTKKQLVCKLINLDKIQGKNSQEDIRRKFQEADILRQLRHPNILPYVDAISSPHSLYTFTELASGGDLMSFILRHGTVKELDSRIIIRQVVRGLGYLHEKDIVHRDLKPENILLAYSPKIAYHRVMLSDFGNSAVPRRSRMITNAGTPGYQAPEFAAGGQAHTAAVDIWSLGVVALLLLASDNHDTELNKMEQGDIAEYLTRLFNGMQTKPSLEGIEFVWNCLKVDPLQRINAYGAKTHRWLCPLKKNRELFKRMDSRSLASWKPQDKLKPMPWVLPDLAPSNPPTPTRSPGSSISQYFTTTPTRFETTTTKSRDRVLEIAAESDTGTATSKTTSSFSVPPRPCGTLRESATNPKKPQPPWQGFRNPNGSANTGFPSKRRRVPRARTHDTANVALPGLERHLRSPNNPNPRYRQNILSALERTKSKFLTDSISPVSRTPLDALASNAFVPPPSPKKRKSKRDERQKESGGANMRHLTFR